MRARYRTIPTLSDLHQLGPMSLGLDVLLVDTNLDKTLVKLQELARVVVKGIGINIPLMIKKIAELVWISSRAVELHSVQLVPCFVSMPTRLFMNIVGLSQVDWPARSKASFLLE